MYLRWPRMGYQALLFCPDEKTARVVTQVLSELEFGIEPCSDVALPLHHWQAYQCLSSGEVNPPLVEAVFVVERDR